jgi:diguanylate cyclase (GGDEF)-like protein/excisionase family DNA binding protein
LVSVAEAARQLGVSPATVRRACDAGVLSCQRSPGGHRRFERSALEGVTRDRLLRSGRDGSVDERGILRALADLSAAASSWQDIDELLRDVAALMLGATGAVTCDIFKLAEEKVFRCLVSLDREGPDEAVIGKELRIDVFAVAGQAIESGQVALIEDRDDPRLSAADRAVYDEYGFACELCIPLLVQDRVVGLVELYGDRPGAFSAALEYARGAAHVLAGALEKALLLDALEDRHRVLRDLLDMAGLLAQTYDVDQLLRTVAGRMIQAVGAAHCDIYRRDGDVYRCLVSAGRDGFLDWYEGSGLALAGNPTSAVALRERRPLVITDVETSELTEPERETLRAQGLVSELLIPLVVKDADVGFIDLFDERPRDWRECIEFAGGVGQLVAGAFENAYLLSRLEVSNRDLHALVDGGLEFGSTLDMERVLLSIARRMRSATEAAECDIFTSEGDLLRVVVAVDEHDDADLTRAGRESRVADFPFIAEALRTGRPVLVNDITEDARADAPERLLWAESGVRSGIMVPLINGASIVGSVALYAGEPRAAWQRDLLLGLGQVAGQAIANARLYEELDLSARRAALLNEISAELSGTLDTRELLKAVTHRVLDMAGVAECAAYLLGDDGVLESVACASLEAPIQGSALGSRTSLSDWPIARLVVSGKRAAAVASLDDARIDAEARALLESHGVESFLVAPLVAKGVVIGTLDLTETRRRREFSADEIDLVEAVCRVAGLAMDNALLFGDLERRNRETSLLNEVARETASSLDLGEIVQAAVAGLKRLFPVEAYGLSLIEDGAFTLVYGSETPGRPRPAGAAGDALAQAIARVRRDRVAIFDGPAGGGAAGGHAAAHGCISSAAIGLFDQEALIGILMLGSSQDHGFSEADAGVLERVGIHLSQAAHNANLYQEIKALHLSNLKGLSTALNAKDYYTLGHAARVAAYMVLLGEELGWERASGEEIREAAYLHDIGKIGVSDRVLLKQGPLNPEEWELMRQHPVVSAEIIEPLFPPHLVSAVRHHHERYDGHGYPDGLAGDDIPELARAMCVVDSYDAMSLQRPYKGALTAQECRTELQRCRGGQFDPLMVDAFARVLDRLASLRDRASAAADEAAARIDPAGHAALQSAPLVDDSRYLEVRAVLREVRDAHPEVRYMTTESLMEKRCIIVVDAEESGSADFSPPGEDVMADDAAQQVLHGRPTASNVLFVDNYGVWVNGLAPLIGADGEIVAAVVADVPALTPQGAEGFARMTMETPVSTLQEAAVRLSRAEVDAITDGLTGLYNHRYLHERLADELDRALRDGFSTSILHCDLDSFKDFNDRNGHSAGDDALRNTARILEQCTRRADLIARYGGEEFMVVLLEADEAVAVEIAGRIRAAVAERHREHEGLTISIGVATFPAAAGTKQALLEAAASSLHAAKSLGRDRVVAAGS